MQDFAIISRCAFRIPISAKDAVAPENEDIMTLENIRVENTVLRNNTGITALFFSAAFLDVSYSPSNAADKNANANHIIIHKMIGKFKNYYCISSIPPQESHHVLAHQRDGGSRVFDYNIVKYGRRSRGV